jgi:hypothetical protein
MQDQQPPPNLPKPWMHDLWAHLHNEHGLTLVESEISEIVRLTAPEWQPIETAPKDGTHILAHDGNTYFPPAVIHWHVDGWYFSNCPIDGNNEYDPASRMPLPTTPQV